MRRFRHLATAILFLLLIAPVWSVGLQDDASSSTAEERRAEAAKLLREAAAAAPGLSSPVNRVIVYIKVAESAWELDPSVSWSMLGSAGEDVKRLLALVDIEANQRDSIAGGSRGRNSGFRSRSNIAFELRKEYAKTLARFAPDQARSFVIETTQMLTNEDLRDRSARDDRNLQVEIEKQIAMNDVGKALEMARERLGKGISSELLGLVGNIYRKDPEKGAEIAGEVLGKLRSAPVDPSRSWIITRFLQAAMRTADSTVPMLDQSGMKALSALLTAYVMDPRSRYTALPESVLEFIESHSKGSADRIRAAFQERVNQRSAQRGVSAGLPQSSVEGREERRDEARRIRQELNKALDDVESDEASEEERLEAISKAREQILGFSDERSRFENLAALAVRAHRSGETEEAVTLMKEAENYLKPSPRERSDFSAAMTIANAYSVVDPDRSLAIFEDMIYRLNGVIDGYVRFAEFSSNGRSVENGELIMNRNSRQFLSYFNLPDNVISALADHDAERLADLADQFDRPEIRIEMKLVLAEALLKTVD